MIFGSFLFTSFNLIVFIPAGMATFLPSQPIWPREFFRFQILFSRTISLQGFQGIIKLVLKGRDKGDPLSVRKWALEQSLQLASLGLSHSIMFAQIRDHPCLSHSTPLPWSPCCKFVRVQGEKNGNPKNSSFLKWKWPQDQGNSF